MPVGVVDRLEQVDVEHHDAELLSRLDSVLHLLPEDVRQVPPVVAAGQGVAQRQLGHLGPKALDRRHLALQRAVGLGEQRALSRRHTHVAHHEHPPEQTPLAVLQVGDLEIEVDRTVLQLHRVLTAARQQDMREPPECLLGRGPDDGAPGRHGAGEEGDGRGVDVAEAFLLVEHEDGVVQLLQHPGPGDGDDLEQALPEHRVAVDETGEHKAERADVLAAGQAEHDGHVDAGAHERGDEDRRQLAGAQRRGMTPRPQYVGEGRPEQQEAVRRVHPEQGPEGGADRGGRPEDEDQLVHPVGEGGEADQDRFDDQQQRPSARSPVRVDQRPAQAGEPGAGSAHAREDRQLDGAEAPDGRPEGGEGIHRRPPGEPRHDDREPPGARGPRAVPPADEGCEHADEGREHVHAEPHAELHAAPLPSVTSPDHCVRVDGGPGGL